MDEIFIQGILVKWVRNLKKFFIPLSEDSLKHLIITGKNGTGKTTFLQGMRNHLDLRTSNNGNHLANNREGLENAINRKKELIANNDLDALVEIDKDIVNIENWFRSTGGIDTKFKNEELLMPEIRSGKYIMAYFEPKRTSLMKGPTGVQKVHLRNSYNISDNPSLEFIQYMVNLKADRSFANDDNEIEVVKKIDEWFVLFEKSFLNLFDSPNIYLKFDRANYNFNIIEEGKEVYNLNQLSSGYSAILNIVTEVIMRMEKNHNKSYDLQGIVLIDEIETHLHVDLQKKILPFLTSFFPKVQFVVTTHSPFVISSIENTVICDLEKLIVTDDLSGYSYDTLIESYFGSDKYSTVLKEKINEYEMLLNLPKLTIEQQERIYVLQKYLDEIPKFISDELAVKLQQLKLADIGKKYTDAKSN